MPLHDPLWERGVVAWLAQGFGEGGCRNTVYRLVGNGIKERFVASSELRNLCIGSHSAPLDCSSLPPGGRKQSHCANNGFEAGCRVVALKCAEAQACAAGRRHMERAST